MDTDIFLICTTFFLASKCIEWLARYLLYDIRDVAVQTEEVESDSDDCENDQYRSANNVLQALHLSLTPPVSPVRKFADRPL